eukprot:3617443-Pyramimonas_sp.AAC.1
MQSSCVPNGATGGFGRAPYVATKRCTGCKKMPNSHVPDGPTGCFGGVLYGTGWVTMQNSRVPDGPTGGFGGAPYGATKRCTGW